MFLTVVVFLVVLSILVLVHELGHFLVAKKMGVGVEEFGLGYPPRMVARKIGETVYSLNWLPFGGFVKLFGEELPDKQELKTKKLWEKAFWAKSKKARTAVILAGVLANFALAIVVFSLVYSASGIPTPTEKIRVVGVAPDSPAEKIGIRNNDIILEVDGQPLASLDHFAGLIEKKKGKEVRLLLEREGEKLVLETTPRAEPPQNEGPLGVVVSNIEMKKFPAWQMPFRGTVQGFREAFGWLVLIAGGLGKMVADLAGKGEVPRDLAGPLGIFQITGTVSRGGVLMVLQFIGVLSVNLAVINVLPFPALDGGRLVFVAYEAVARRRPKPSLERWINTIGMALLLFLIVLVTINDISRILQTSGLLAQLRSFLINQGLVF